MRRLLSRFAECRAFLPDEAESGGDGRPADPLAERLERYLDRRARLGQLEAAHVAGLRARWAGAGARPADWLAAYGDQSGPETRLTLSEEARHDAPIWWWLLCGGLNAWLLLRPADGEDPKAVLATGYDPFTIGGTGKGTWDRPMATAKRETGRSTRWRPVVHPHEYGSMVASGAETGAAIPAGHRATLTPRLWARE